MKTAEEVLQKYGNWDKNGLAEWHKDCIIEAMNEYAKQQVKNLSLSDVSNNEVAVCDLWNDISKCQNIKNGGNCVECSHEIKQTDW